MDQANPIDPRIEEVRNSFQKELNLHGYGFQFAVLNKARHAVGKGSRWAFKVIELPVQVQGTGTRIDFVLVRRGATGFPIVMLAECKRANPALANWCFICAPISHSKRHKSSEQLIMEKVVLSQDVRGSAEKGLWLERAYQVGIEVRSKQKGDVKGETGRAIENAASQVLRGLNGYVEMLEGNRQLLEQHRPIYLLPVVFTTAGLWVSEADLFSANVETGEIELNNKDFKEVPWLWYQYHSSPGLKHSRGFPVQTSKVEELMDAEYVRTIAIVNSAGIEDFLLQTTEFEFF